MRVFISSTCYDLVDLRAELEVFFREAGVEVKLSESMSSEFQVHPDRNSIETCLANVRDSDEFIIILSNRYGPSLAKADYADVSATHLEYHEAVKHKKAIRMFVRDRLEADYTVWKKNSKNPNMELAWCKGEQDRKIFSLLEEHRKLSKRSGNNWFWIYRDSVEVKKRLALEYKEAFARAAVSKLAANGRIPFIEITGKVPRSDAQFFHMNLFFRNLADNVAVAPLLEFVGTINKIELEGLAGQQTITRELSWARQPGTKIELKTKLSYSILEGHKFVDEGVLLIDRDPHSEVWKISYSLKKRSYSAAETSMVLAF